MKDLLAKLCRNEDLTREESTRAFRAIMAGEAEPAAVGGLLLGLQMKGVTADELAAAALAMREHVLPIDAGDLTGVVDTCGTGGTGSGTFNISTAAAIVAAASGVRVVKHGNRRASSQSGSADVLEELGVSLDADPKACLEAAGICFAFARNHHPAMKHVAPFRQALGVPTIFNLLGPIANPAGVRRQLLGVARPELTELMAHALLMLGSERAWVVHSEDGQDDLAADVPAKVTEVRDGEVTTWTFDPQPLGLTGGIDRLKVDSPKASAELIRAIFDGDEEGAPRDAVLLNAAAAVAIAGGAEDVASAVEVARHAIESGRASATLAGLIDTSRATAPAPDVR